MTTARCGRDSCGHAARVHDPAFGCDDAECPCTGYMPPMVAGSAARSIQLTRLGLWTTEHVAARIRAERRGVS